MKNLDKLKSNIELGAHAISELVEYAKDLGIREKRLEINKKKLDDNNKRLFKEKLEYKGLRRDLDMQERQINAKSEVLDKRRLSLTGYERKLAATRVEVLKDKEHIKVKENSVIEKLNDAKKFLAQAGEVEDEKKRLEDERALIDKEKTIDRERKLIPRGDSREIAIGFKSDLTNTYVPWEGNPSTGAGKVDLEDSLPPKSDTGIEGAPVTVGTTAVELTSTGTTRSISIQSDQDNTGKVWFGLSNVTNAGANAFGRLDPGRAVTIELDDSSNAIYAVSDTAAQKVFKMAIV